MLLLRILFIAIISLLVTSCSVKVVEPEADNFSVSFGVDESLQKQNLESIELTNVKILVKSLKLTAGRDKENNVKLDPFVVELDFDGNVKTIALVNLPDANYEKVKFDIHKLNSKKTPTGSEFNDFSDNTPFGTTPTCLSAISPSLK